MPSMKENGESAVRFGKVINLIYHLTTRVAVLHTFLQTSSLNQTACPSCFKQYFPSLLGGENIYNCFSKSIAILISHYFIEIHCQFSLR